MITTKEVIETIKILSNNSIEISDDEIQRTSTAQYRAFLVPKIVELKKEP